MNELAIVPGVVSDATPGVVLSLVPDLVPDPTPSNPKNLIDQKTVRRKAYVPPRVEDLGSIESITFQTSFILR